jgi:uncharacterized protein (TIGR00661 family)
MPAEADHLAPDLPRKRVLVAPLNWGLGHAARCVPIIRALEKMGAQVVLASDGVALRLLEAEFPHLPTVSLPSYGIKYFPQNMVLNIARQLPRMLYAIRAEKWHTARIVQEYNIQGIISDNRYGCFHRQIKNVMVTHQLHLRVPQKALQWCSNRILRLALSKFEEIWVPDSAGEPSLSGELSHPAIGQPKTQYIGLLSRSQGNEPIEQEYDVAVVLSGPEPQRSNLEQLLLEQALALPHKFIFILGKTHSKEHHYVSENVEVVSYLTSHELNRVVAASQVVICRSGYSSLMDLAAMGKQAILIPTPGQTEQEYLAESLSKRQLFVVQQQDQIDLETALEAVLQTPGLSTLNMPVNQFETKLRVWLNAL